MIEEMELPENWSRDKIGNVFFTTSGGTPSRKNPNYYIGSIPWVKSGELDKGLITQTEEYISPEAIENSSAKVFPKGTLLIALYGATIGKLGFLGVDAATNQAICGIFDNGNFSLQYTKYFLFHNRNKLIEQGAGGAQPNISQTILKELSIVIPPLAEQHRIVAKIEELFSSLDKAIESINTAKEQLKVYRQAVLKYAFEGRFTNDNVKDGELPQGWTIEPLGKMFDFVGGGTPSKNEPDYWGGEIYWASVKDVKGNYLNKTEDKITLKGLNESASNMADAGDVILITRIMPGRTIIANVKVAINQDLKIVKPKFKTTSKFIHYYFQSIERECKNRSSGTTVLGITLNNLNEIDMPVLGFEEQNQIVQEIESRLSVCDKIEEGIENSLLQAEALRQSILKRAFEGKLLPQDPNDEPASKLIERIKAERAKGDGVKIKKERKTKQAI